jgi:hypothetical protein
LLLQYAEAILFSVLGDNVSRFNSYIEYKLMEMTKTELFRHLSANQKKEFEKDINAAIDDLIGSKKIVSGNLNNIKIHLRLENKIFLHVLLTIDNKGQVFKNQYNITRFKNVDQFLDSLIEVRKNRAN